MIGKIKNGAWSNNMQTVIENRCSDEMMLNENIVQQRYQLFIESMQGGGKMRQCKFGPNCFKFANGSCTFYHPPGQQPNPRPPRPQRPFDHAKSDPFNPNSNPTYNQGSNYNSNSSYPNNNYNNNYNNSYNNNKNYPNNNFNNPTTQGGNYPPQNSIQGGNKDRNDDPIQAQLCRNFHIGAECKFGEKCNRKHSFIVSNDDAIRRFQLIRNVPNQVISKLTKFRQGEKDYFAVRNGLEVCFFQFNCETKELKDIFQYCLPDPKGKYNFYDHKKEYIYYSRLNPDTSFEDMGFYNLIQQRNYFVANSHEGRITGIDHFTDNIIISTTMSGELKVWVQEGEELKCHQETTERLKSYFNPLNAKLELYFVDISEVSGTKIVSVGTNDNRVLFFTGPDLSSYRQVKLGDQYSQVFKVRYTTGLEVPTAVVLTWNHNKTMSAILQIELKNCSMRPLVQVRTTEDQPKFILNTFEFVHGYLMVANLGGFVSIYAYPDTTNKIGGIFHQNQISDIIASEDQLKNTNLKIKTMMILQKKTEQKEGSLGIYLLK